MTQDWQDCPTFQSVAEALDRGDEIACRRPSRDFWELWVKEDWFESWKYRCLPAKPKVKTVVMREIEVTRHNLKMRMFVSDLTFTGNKREEEVPND